MALVSGVRWRGDLKERWRVLNYCLFIVGHMHLLTTCLRRLDCNTSLACAYRTAHRATAPRGCRKRTARNHEPHRPISCHLPAEKDGWTLRPALPLWAGRNQLATPKCMPRVVTACECELDNCTLYYTARGLLDLLTFGVFHFLMTLSLNHPTRCIIYIDLRSPFFIISSSK
ncbi:unnamed protein product [Arctogadus glacialis]